jgi:hypothetical protein
VVRYIFRNLAVALGSADTLPPLPSG